MKEGLVPNQHRIYKGRTRPDHTGFMKEGLKKGLDPNKHRIYEGRTRS